MYVHEDGVADSIPLEEWEGLAAGTRVEVHTKGRYLGTGVVDTVMPDGSIVWFWLDGGGRQLVHATDDAKLYERH